MISKAEYEFYDHHPAAKDMRQEVVEGLRRDRKTIPPKYFYDEAGSRLFEAITHLPEYYLTRTEMALFESNSDDIATAVGEGGALIEYGSGSSRKVRKLLESARPQAYVPVDISKDHLQHNATQLHQDFPWLNVYPTCADFTQTFDLPLVVAPLAKTGFFPGSSIGNFDPVDAQAFLATVGTTLGAGAQMLIGVDRKKPVAVLEAAYNDASGITAEFNLNVLSHINEALGADFDPNGFRHLARYNEKEGCIQMFLISTREQQVLIDGQEIPFLKDEPIHTENSFKYDALDFVSMAGRAGFGLKAAWHDPREWFSVFLLSVE
ncbi:MAG: L-histidine N(alpha)-methyltransferase [Proteobacteria bacterium]|nr:L-histidine N(alpha)-methyltransferase [Pseudomonadota bacterium]